MPTGDWIFWGEIGFSFSTTNSISSGTIGQVSRLSKPYHWHHWRDLEFKIPELEHVRAVPVIQ